MGIFFCQLLPIIYTKYHDLPSINFKNPTSQHLPEYRHTDATYLPHEQTKLGSCRYIGGNKTWTVKSVSRMESSTRAGSSESVIGTKRKNVLFVGPIQMARSFVRRVSMRTNLSGWKWNQAIWQKMISKSGRSAFFKPSFTPTEPLSFISGVLRYLLRPFGEIFQNSRKRLNLVSLGVGS